MSCFPINEPIDYTIDRIQKDRIPSYIYMYEGFCIRNVKKNSRDLINENYFFPVSAS